MISEDEYLERIVAGIHSVTTAGADVTWNEVINGRQFDVVVRFKLGSLRYLVLVEVRNRTRKAGASDMDAFVLKARDQNANKAVFVTAAGFQQGAITVAKRHAVDLFTVTFDEAKITLPRQASFLTLRKKGAPKNISPSLSFGEPTLIANIENAILMFADGKQFEMPDEQSQMNYYVRKTKLLDGRTLDDVIQAAPLGNVELGESRDEEILIDPPQNIEPPDDYFFPAVCSPPLSAPSPAARADRFAAIRCSIPTCSRCPLSIRMSSPARRAASPSIGFRSALSASRSEAFISSRIR